MLILALRRWAALDHAERARLLARSTAVVFDAELMAGIERIFADVRERGDAAVADATLRFDRARIGPDALRVPETELERAHG